MEGHLSTTQARWGLGGFAVLVAALVAGVLLLRPGVDEFEAGTPEATVQGYLEAVLDGDQRGALSYLAPDLQAACRRQIGSVWVPESARVTLKGTYVDDGQAEVDVVVTEYHPPGPFESGSNAFDVTLYLDRTADGWAISAAPWPLWACEEMP